MQKTFADYGIDVNPGATGEVKVLCPKCSHRRKKSKEPILNVNIEKGTWKCWNDDCGWSGCLQKSEPCFAPIPKQRKPGLNKQDLTPQAIKWLDDRAISNETAVALHLKSVMYGFKENGEWVNEPAIAIPFIKNGVEVNNKVRSIAHKHHMAMTAGGEMCAYNFDTIKGASEIAITEGEMDAIAVYESGYKQVISCPNGAAQKNDKNVDKRLAFLRDPDIAQILDGVKTVILAMDCDEVGIHWRNIVAKEIGLHKCRIAVYPPSCKDMNDVLMSHGKEVVLECLHNAKPVPVPGVVKSIDKREDIIKYYKSGGIARGASTGFRLMDGYFNIVPGQLTTVTGIPQSGKSEWLDQIMLQTIQLHGWKWAVFSPENHPHEFHFQKLAEKLIGKPMFGQNAMTPRDVDNAVMLLTDGIDFISCGDDEELPTVNDVLVRLKVCKERSKINAAIIDPYNEIDHKRPNGISETEYIGGFLSKMRRFARANEIALFIVAHPTKMQKRDDGNYPVPTPYDINGGANWRNKSDNVITVWRKYALPPQPTIDDTAVVVGITKVRNKNVGMCGSVKFTWDRATGLFSEITPSVAMGYSDRAQFDAPSARGRS